MNILNASRFRNNNYRMKGILIIFVIIGGFTLCINGCKSKNPATITDVDGNIYHTVTIGTQVWMAENLKVTKYRNGDIIPNVKDTVQWCYLPTGTYCNYENNPQNTTVYGLLYNWYAITDSRGIAPKGWHIPTFEELETLVSYLGGDTIAAGKLKEAGTGHWLYPNVGSKGKYNFLALPGGYRHYMDGTFHARGSNGYWWTTTQSFEMYSWSERLYEYFANARNVYDFKALGLSVRCVKD